MKKSEETIRYLWDTIKSTNICILRVSEEETEKGIEGFYINNGQFFFPNLVKKMDIQTLKTQLIPNKMNFKKYTLGHILIKFSKMWILAFYSAILLTPSPPPPPSTHIQDWVFLNEEAYTGRVRSPRPHNSEAWFQAHSLWCSRTCSFNHIKWFAKDEQCFGFFFLEKMVKLWLSSLPLSSVP